MSKAHTRIRNYEIERFRVDHGFTISEACECLGLQRARWSFMLKPENRDGLLEDHTVCELLEFYKRFPETIPIKRLFDIREHMSRLGLDPESSKDKTIFSTIHGTEKAGAYRWLDGGGRPSAPVERLMAAMSRLDVSSGKKRLDIMVDITREVAERQGIEDPIVRGKWSKGK